MAETLNAAEAVVRSLVLNGIDTIFGLPGVQNDVLFAALHDAQDKIRVVHTRHEQGAAYMALGAAMATGKPQAYVVVPGPGFLKSTGALCTAYACNAPVLALTGQIPQAMIGRGLGFLHELPDQLGIMRAADQIRRAHPRAARSAAYHERGVPPVALGPAAPGVARMPARCLAEARRDGFSRPRPRPRTRPIDPDAIEAAAKLLGAASNPLIVIGGGAHGRGRGTARSRRACCKRRSAITARASASSTAAIRGASRSCRSRSSGPMPMSCSPSARGCKCSR